MPNDHPPPHAALQRLATAALATSATVSLHDNLGRTLRHARWPSSAAGTADLSTLLPALTLLDPLHDHWWAARPGTALEIPESVVLAEPHFAFLHAPLGHRHLAVCSRPPGPDGTQTLLTVARDHDHPFTPAELRLFEQACADEASGALLDAARLPPLAPAPAPREHRVALAPDLAPLAPSRFILALLALFYGPLRADSSGRPLLPIALETDIRQSLAEFQRGTQTTGHAFRHAFTRRHRGRVLCLAVHTEPPAGLVLDAHEDVSQLPRLRRIKDACGALPRDRAAIFAAALVVAEGVHDAAEVARRAGFGALKTSSALRLVNCARRLVEQAS